MSEPTGPFLPATITCHTPGCENEGIPIDVDMGYPDEFDPDLIHRIDGAICGPCRQPITDIVYREVGS